MINQKVAGPCVRPGQGCGSGGVGVRLYGCKGMTWYIYPMLFLLELSFCAGDCVCGGGEVMCDFNLHVFVLKWIYGWLPLWGL